MSRSVAWRRTCSDSVSWRQDQASNTTIFILRETGPTGFLLKEEGGNKKFKVFLGDPHSCTCPIFTKEKDLCKHILWVLLKKFRVPRQNPVTWQLGLVEREINEILRGQAAKQKVKVTSIARHLAAMVSPSGEKNDEENSGSVPSGQVAQRPISGDDVCPICQEELLAKHMPVTYCKFGCGNSVHIKCMKVWAEHQQTTAQSSIQCPFCREDFGPFSMLKQEFRNSSVRETRANHLNHHLGVVCKRCHACPIIGKCYRCTVCQDFHLCQSCFNTPVHQEHPFQFREKTSQRWRPATRGTGNALPQAVIQNLMNRDISDHDYDLLLQLDSQSASDPSDLTEGTVRSLPLERVQNNGPLLAPGQQCRICLQRFLEGQHVRRLPCKHKFHKDCIDNWLLHQHATCPVDGTRYTNQSVREFREATRLARQPKTLGADLTLRQNSAPVAVDTPQLALGGVGISRQEIPAGTTRHTNLSTRSRGSVVNSRGLRSDSVVSEPAGMTVSGRHYGSMIEDAILSLRTGLGGSHSNLSNYSLPPGGASRSQPSTPGDSTLSTAPDVIIQVPPSIPLPRNDSNLVLDNINRKPPSGPQADSDGESGRRHGRLHKRVSMVLSQRTRSLSGKRRDRSSSAERPLSHISHTQILPQGSCDLFVGNDPSSEAGFAGAFVTSTNQIHRQNVRPKKTSGLHLDSDSRYRWGNVQEYEGSNNDIVLSGNAVAGLSLQH